MRQRAGTVACPYALDVPQLARSKGWGFPNIMKPVEANSRSPFNSGDGSK
ncbi:hypothetical protein KKE26_12925 [bacterium]|nr:hypothetical protein [bacterium]MBU1752777.1 hypothetical protein [bacterium]